MERILRVTTTVGTGAVVAGVVSEFFLYDGNFYIMFIYLLLSS